MDILFSSNRLQKQCTVEAANNPLPQKADGGLDWNGVTMIRILGIEDTHA